VISSAVPLAQLMLGSKSQSRNDDGSSSSKKRKVTSSPTAGESCVASNISSLPRVSDGGGTSDIRQKPKAPQHASPANPVDFIFEAFKANGSANRVMKSIESPAFSHRPTDDEIASYSLEVVNAIRSRSLEKLKELHKEGRSLQCCNRFGEALIHMACRRGYTDIVKFMVGQAGVSLYVHDDFGRTPLHYACWTPEPNFELLGFLIQQEPELLLMSDVRGHLPFNYVRKEHWKGWVKFLKEREDSLRTIHPPRVVG